MATGSDVREILELEDKKEDEFITKDALFNNKNKKVQKKNDLSFKRPEGMHRELWGLLWTDNKDQPPLMPADTSSGYKQTKAKIGRSKVRPWKWMPFTNPARKDGAIFSHWRRVADEGKDYPFARFNKSVDVPVYSDMEYQQHLSDDHFTRLETDHLFELCKRFDLRFVVINDRWDRERFPNRSVEDLKERYYNICNILTKVRAPQGTEPKIRVFDAEHERRRKEQLDKLFNRTTDQVEEEQYLVAELKKIELRKKEREKKTQDLQKLITAADTNIEARRSDRKATKKKVLATQKASLGGATTPDTTGIKFPDFKQSGVSIRSQRIKLPASVGQKKIKAIEQVLEELGIEVNPMPFEDMVHPFNELRQDIVLLYELKLALANCEYELQTLRHRFDTLAPGKMPDMSHVLPGGQASSTAVTASTSSSSTSDTKMLTTSTPSTPSTSLLPTQPATSTPTHTSAAALIESLKAELPAVKSEPIDVLTSPGTPNRKRKAALEQGNILKKIKQKF